MNDGWDDHLDAIAGRKENNMKKSPDVFDDTHDILTRGETVERSTRDMGSQRDNSYAQSRDVDNLDSHTEVDERYVRAPWQADIKDHHDAWFQNGKRTYDEYQHESLRGMRRADKADDYNFREMSQYDSARQNIANQALQNAVETANIVSKNNLETGNMVAKQAIRHADLSISEQWSRMETSDVFEGLVENEGIRSASLDDAALKAIGAAVADAVVSALSARGK